MPVTKKLHIGFINIGTERVCDVYKGTRDECLQELNIWILNYAYVQGLTILQLPPLDDWTLEASGWWSYHPDGHKHILIGLYAEDIKFP